MFKRSNSLIKSNSFFVFGARGTGKSTLIRQTLSKEKVLEIDLLDPEQLEEALFGLPELRARLEAAIHDKQWVFIDEVQKAPRLLDVIQSLIDRKGGRFAISGSSARKLKRGAANLLAGRAYTFNLYPLTSAELGEAFDLMQYLKFGGLPHVWNVSTEKERVLFLRSYVSTYLKEEIAEEQIVRNLEPFTKFLQVAAQMSGYLINFSSIAKDVGVSDQTVKTYFQILEDTLLGFSLQPYDKSVRKAQGKTPKFYLFDMGILRALQRSVDQPMDENHFAFGLYFEHFIIQELMRRSEYAGFDFKYSFLRLDDKDEIDLIIDRPGRPEVVIEIKSTKKVLERHTTIIKKMAPLFPKAEFFLLSNDKKSKIFDSIHCCYWQEGITKILG